MTDIYIDFETRSRADLRKVGAYKYAAAPSTELLCMAFAFDRQPVQLWRRGDPWPSFPEDATYVAHNAMFELAIWSRVVAPRFNIPAPPLRKWRCTAAKAALIGLPRDLEGACAELNLPHQKAGKLGKDLINYLCKPYWRTGEFREEPYMMELLEWYCMQDVDASRGLDIFLPDEPLENDVWIADQRVNARGAHVDIEFLFAAIELAEQVLEEDIEELQYIGISSPNAVQQIVSFCREHNWPIRDLRAATVEASLAKRLPPLVRKVLEIRLRSAKSSVAKYRTALARVEDDDRVRDLFLYSGAHTGRWAGKGVQTQNMPRGDLKEKNVEPIERIKRREWRGLARDYGPVMDLLKSCTRGMFTAAPGKILYGGDYSKIECVGLAAVAGQDDLVEELADGVDVYKGMARRIFRQGYDDSDPSHRQLGKTAILGLGYGMGHVRFRGTCESDGLPVTEQLARHSVKTYRDAYPAILAFWGFLEEMCIAAIRHPDRRIKHKHYPDFWFCYRKKIDFLFIRTPSGRKLFYKEPRIVPDKWPSGAPKQTLSYLGAAPGGRKLITTKTYGAKICENVIQALCRDLLAFAMVTFEKARVPVVLHAHDEIVCEVDPAKVSLETFSELMTIRPPWALHWPIALDAWERDRYYKA